MKSRTAFLASLLAALAAATVAHAHFGQIESNSCASGLAHPLSGWDHLLAMVAIGFWAAQLGGPAHWRVPTVFVGMMSVAAIAGASFGPLPLVDQGAAATVLALGLLIGTAARLPAAAGLLLAAFFALFHGYAHGAEMPATAGGLAYGAGFVLTTALLHAAGLGLGAGVAKLSAKSNQLIGWAVAAAGVAVMAN